jgi:hypothetical protein
VGTVGPGITAVNTFSVSAQSFIHVTMASLISNANGEVADGGSVVLGFGTPSGATCATTASQVVTPNLSAQIRSGQLPAGTYCFSVGDAGTAGSATFSVRITTTSAVPPESGLSGTESFSSQLPRGGTAVHTFQVNLGGTATVTLSTARADQVLRMGVGLWDGGACRIAFSVDTALAATPQLLGGVDAGTYCVSLRDNTATHQTPFTLTITHP